MTQAGEQVRATRRQDYSKFTWPGTSRLGDYALSLAYIGWIPLVMLIVGLILASIPTYSAFLHLPRVSSGLAPADPGGQLTKSGIQELQACGFSLNAYIAYLVSGNLLLVVSFLGMGTLIVWRTWGKAKDWMAICAAYALVTFPVNIIALMLRTLPSGWGVLINILSFLGVMCFLLFGCLFPNGRFVPRWTGFLALETVIIWGIYIFVPAASRPSSILAAIIFVLILLSLGCLLCVQVYRFRRVSNQVQRQQSKWVFFGLGIFAVGSILWFGLSVLLYFQGMFAHVLVQSLFNVSQIFLLLLIPLSIGFAILRYRLWDIDFIINHTLVYGILTASVISLYVLVVVSLGTLFQARGNLVISLCATAIIAVLFQPLRELLQHAVNRLMYGERDDPYRVISRMGRRLEATVAPDAVLPTIVETVSQALKLPYAALTLKYGDEFSLAASHGVARGEIMHLPLIYQSEQVGELQLAPRTPGESFAPADRKLLDDLARQVGVAAHAVRLTQELKHLTQDLQQARERLVSAREEERRRLCRDLHDGLGLQVSSQTLLLTSAQMLLRQDPDEAEIILKNAVTQSQQAVSDIRRLVYALRPPALDDLGLIAAIAEQLVQNRASGIVFSIETPEHLPPLPAAVEVACYRIVQEALTNVVRHAHAHTCTLRLSYAEQLIIEVIDDGQGLPPAYHSGVGLTSMRERAEELGGSWLIEPGPLGGTRVRAQIPYRGVQA